jgi:SM-20-related protein
MTLAPRPVAPALDPAVAEIAQALRATGFCETRNLLPSPLLAALTRDCAQAIVDGLLRPAGVGRAASHRREAALRGDSILWLDPEGTPSECALLERMDALRIALNRELLLGLHELEAHYAAYPPGRGYARHRDRFRDDDARVLSMVIYLNADWPDDAGGELRLHLPEGMRDVAPRLGTSVFFLSDEIEHEVLPAQRERLSIAGWFRRRA